MPNVTFKLSTIPLLKPIVAIGWGLLILSNQTIASSYFEHSINKSQYPFVQMHTDKINNYVENEHTKIKSSHLITDFMHSPHQSSQPFKSSYTLPDLGGGGERFVEVNQHKAIGEWSLQQLNGGASLLEDAWTQEQLELMAWKINAQARMQAPLALVLINNASINAFAIPGGVMGINTGTILAANSIDEVASVIAHEVAHLSQRHYENRGESDEKALLIKLGGVLAAIAASQVDGEAATAIMMGSQTAALNSQMAFSRSNEREADRIGMQLMAQAGFDPNAMPRFFATLHERSQLNSGQQDFLPSFIMSHPLSAERLSDTQSMARSYQISGLTDKPPSLIFGLLQWRIKALSNQTTAAEMLVASKNILSNKQSAGTNLSNFKEAAPALALASWYAKKGQYDRGLAVIEAIRKYTAQINAEQISYISRTDLDELNVLIAITEAQILSAKGKWNKTETILLPYFNLYPERRDIALYMTDIWLQLDKHDEAISALKKQLSQKPHDVSALDRLHRAYELRAKVYLTIPSKLQMSTIATANAMRYRALAQMWRGKYDDALLSIHQAKQMLLKLDADTTTITQIGSQSSNQINVKPLLVQIENDLSNIKTAKDFSP